MCERNTSTRAFFYLTVGWYMLTPYAGAAQTDKKVAASASQNVPQRLLYTSPRKANVHIILVNDDGTDAKQLTSGQSSNFYPAWSPDGKKIAFTRQEPRGKGLFVMDADGRNMHRLTFGWDTQPDWSPDGKRIVYAHHVEPNIWRIMTITMNDDAEFRATSDNAQPTADVHYVKELTEGTQNDSDPAWSPDGKKIAFASARSGGGGFRLYVMNADGSNVRDISQSENPDGWVFPSWSPDGKRIVYTDWSDETRARQIFVVDADGNNKKQLTNTGSYSCYAAWSRDGKTIAYMSYKEPNSKGDLTIMKPDGTGQKIIVNEDGGRTNGRPAWRPK